MSSRLARLHRGTPSKIRKNLKKKNNFFLKMEKGKRGGGPVLGELSLDEEGSSNSSAVPPKVCLERTDDSGSQFLF